MTLNPLMLFLVGTTPITHEIYFSDCIQALPILNPRQPKRLTRLCPYPVLNSYDLQLHIVYKILLAHIAHGGSHKSRRQ